MSRSLRVITAVLLLAGVAPAYYHFLHFTNGSTFGLPEKFDVNSLPGGTLTYFVQDAAATVQLAPGDSFESLLSQIRAAAKVWNDVDRSALRLAFGGVQIAHQAAGPAMEILFEETPPGIVAMGGPTVRADSNGAFVPILNSTVIVQPDLRNRATHTEALFGTLVHEIGHALGLQHTFTSGVMSTGITRSTSKARPLSADDVAGISILYPRPGSAGTGTITGRVLYEGGSPAVLASVVAISPNGAAISTLSNPDGSYRIEGLASSNYYVYVHPLPPPREGQATPGDIVFPVDSEGEAIPNSAPFETVFFSGSPNGTKDPSGAVQLVVPPGGITENVNFFVRQRSGNGIHSVETYAYPGNVAVKPPYLSPGMLRPFFIATGPGLVSGNRPVSGLTATVLGGAALQVRPYSVAPASWVQLDLNQQALLIPSDSARHVVFSANNDIYVLPSAFFHVSRQPPQIAGVAPVEDAPQFVAVTGANLTPATKILFDGVEAQVRSFEETEGGARIVVTPPPAFSGHRAVLTALNPDGQSSLFVQSEAPPAYFYPSDGSPAPAAVLNPNFVPSGVETTIQIDVTGMQLRDGQVSVGFGSTAVSVRKVWVASPTRLLANIAVSPNAQQNPLTLTIASGLQFLSQPFALFPQGPQARPFWLSSTYANAVTGQPAVSPGNAVTMLAGAAPVPLAGSMSVLIGEQRVPVSAVNGNLFTFVIPAGAPVGPMTVRLEINGERSLPITIPVEAPVATILSASVTSFGSAPAVALEVGNLSERSSGLSVAVNGLQVRVLQISREDDTFRVVAELPAESAKSGKISLTVTSEARTSNPFSLTIGG